jgi:hypothetical protein
MTRTVVKRTIHAPIERVFETVADVRNFSKALPYLVEVEFLSDNLEGIGTRFRETRIMKGKRASTELEITEFVENERVRLVADSHGTVWDTVFIVRPVGDAVELEMIMEARAYKLVAKLMNPLIKGLVAKAIKSDMDAVKEYCEAET